MRAFSLLFLLGVVACGGSEAKTTTPPLLDASAPDARESDSGLACTNGADCPAGVCCRNVLPLGPSECRKDCFTDAPRVQMCSPGEKCQSGNACQVWPDACGAGPGQGYCESPSSYCP